MDCKFCEHCDSPVYDKCATYDGHSYHYSCHKCYVCSETNLRNAEIFKGVIFCSDCSQRIFQGCYDVKRTKVQDKNCKKYNRCKAKAEKMAKKLLAEQNERVLELTQFQTSTDTDSKLSDCTEDISKTLPNLTANEDECRFQRGNGFADTFTTTKVTKVVLDRASKRHSVHNSGDDNREFKWNLQSRRKKYKENVSRTTKYCSDLRIAELGASTEIGNMALKEKSETPFLIKPKSQEKPGLYEKFSSIDKKRTVTESSDTNSTERQSTSDLSTIKEFSSFRDLKMISFVATPIRCFKKNILNRSSLISCIMRECSTKTPLTKEMTRLFCNKTYKHHKRGLKRLYSTINRNKSPYKLGWVDLKAKQQCLIKSGDCEKHPVQCRHFINSHYYRCMRNQAMRLAGPTKSQLRLMRSKILRRMVPENIINALSKMGRPTTMLSEGCGPSTVVNL